MDLATLWYLTIGTLLLGASMTVWERQALLQRGHELGLWATSYVLFAIGCIVAMNRTSFPGVSGWALTNLLMMAAYLTVLHGARRLDGSVRWRGSAVLLATLALLWVIGGRHPDLLWNHLTALPIAATCMATAWVLWRSRTAKHLRARPLASAVFLCHGLFYGFRGFVSPVLATLYGEAVLPVVAKVTMYESVLFSMAMPMALLALVKEEHQAQLLAASRSDFLTGLHNRQGFFEHGAKLLSAHGLSRPVTLLAFDLDHFKAINDRFGHEAGDDVLKRFARAAREIVGRESEVARLGGEEFVVLLPGIGRAAGCRIAEAIASRFTEAAAEDGRNISATVSIGVAESNAETSGLPALLAAADRALYRAKGLGRNRIEIAESLDMPAAA